jgi:hypothetical protein
MKAEMEEMKCKYAEVESSFAGTKTENSELKEFKAETIKKEKSMMAFALYKKYEDYISDEEKTDLDAKLFATDKFEDFQKEVFSLVLPKMETKLNIKGDVNLNQSDFNFSMMAHLLANKPDEKKPETLIEKLKQI